MSDKKVVELYYCKDCKMIVFRYRDSVGHYGISSKETDEYGNVWEEEFDCSDSEVYESICYDCEETLHTLIWIPFDLFEKLYKHVSDAKANGFEVELENPDELSPEELRNAIFEALI